MGSSQSECDTVAGRQCMASCFFLMQQYDEAASYLGSIASYFDGNPLFHWNYGMALVAAAEAAEDAAASSTSDADEERGELLLRMHQSRQLAEEHLLRLLDSSMSTEPDFVRCLGACFIANRKPKAAWNLVQAYRRQEQSGLVEEELQEILEHLAPRFHAQGAFLYAARAYGWLESRQSMGAFWEGLRSSCVCLFEHEVHVHEGGGHSHSPGTVSSSTTSSAAAATNSSSRTAKVLREVTRQLLQSSNPEAENIVRIMHDWADSVGVSLDSLPASRGV